MIKVTVLIGEQGADTSEVISAVSIREAVDIAQARHPGEGIRVAFPIDPETFSTRRLPRVAPGLTQPPPADTRLVPR